MEKPRKKRGMNKVEYLPEGESVMFNNHGAAVGKHQRKFAKYCKNAVIDHKEKELLLLDFKVYYLRRQWWLVPKLV